MSKPTTSRKVQAQSRARPVRSSEWAVADGKAKFSELIERAAQAPQTITRNGKPVAVIVGVDEWARKSGRKGTLSEFFQTAPEGFADLDFSRSKEVARDIDLWKLLLDTNVVSEAARDGAELRVRRWLDARREEEVVLSAVTIAEIRQGIASLPAGKRRGGYEAWLGELRIRYAGRIIAVSEEIADRWGRLAGEMRSKGRPMPIMDGFIAATAIVHSCIIATRNIRHFQQFDIDVVDPWRVAR